ncbi:uncharacterized protein LOC102806356 [Saccoglossus kowalevskii]
MDFRVIYDVNYLVQPDKNIERRHKKSIRRKNGMDKHCLDLYLPTRPLPYVSLNGGQTYTGVASPPVVVFVHGGGWRRGDRQSWNHFMSSYDTNLLMYFLQRYYGTYSNVGETFAKRGIACAVISYPLSRLQLSFVLVEMFLSFVMSIASVGILLTLAVCLAQLLLFITTGNFGVQYFVQFAVFHGAMSTPVLSTLCIYVGLSQIVVWIIALCLHRKNYPSLRPHSVALITVFAGLCGYLCTKYDLLSIEHSISLSSVLLVFLSQVILLTVYFADVPTLKHPSQIRSIAQSIRWVRKYGIITKLFNIRKLFLCGYSAGGHMVSFLTLNSDVYLQEVGLDLCDIKGVISISGIYNLHSLAEGSRCLQELYLTPTFESKPSCWTIASPVTYIKYSLNDMPRFLITNAEWDFGLDKDAREFVMKLQNHGYQCEYHVIKGSSHFSLAMLFGQNGQTLHKICIRFIDTVLQQNKTTEL